ncbi:mechanosensitive ion channel family protein [Micrococcus luteus]
MVFPIRPALATPPLLTALDRLLAGAAVPSGVEGDIQDGAAATTRAFGVEWGTLLTVLMAFAIGAAVVYLALQVARVVLVRRPAFQHGAARLSLPAAVVAGLLASRIWLGVMAEEQTWYRPASFLMLIAVAAAAAWAAWRLVGVIEAGILDRYQETGVEHRRERRIRTQTILIRRILNAVIVVVAVAVVLLGVPEVRSLGAGLLASAGVVSVIAGLAVQSTLTNVFAGFQLAFTDAIRVGDVVDMEGVFGTVEEITLSNVVLKLWDGRRMVYPSSHFTTQPFENWTRVGSAVSGTVEMDVDWRVPMEDLRDRLKELLASTDLWDGRDASMQVTDAIGGMVRIRAVVSARSSGDLWDLRCLVREDLVNFIRHDHPEAIHAQRLGVLEAPFAAEDPAEDTDQTDDDGTASAASSGAGSAPAPSGAPAEGGTASGGVASTAEKGETAAGEKASERGEVPPPTARLPRLEGHPAPRTGPHPTAPLARVGQDSSMYTGSITAVERNREFAGPGEEAYAERKARAEQERRAAEGQRGGAEGERGSADDEGVQRAKPEAEES